MDSTPRRKPVPPTPSVDHSRDPRNGPYRAVPYVDRYAIGEETAHNRHDMNNEPFDHFNTPILNSNDEIRRSAMNQTHPIRGKIAELGINWLREPLQMPVCTLCGIVLALGHHFFFAYLDGRQASDEGALSQQIVKQIGNAFAFLVLALLKAAILVAYNQYIWAIFRRRSLKIAVIDKALSLPSSLASSFSFELLGEAKLALIIGTFSWYVKQNRTPLEEY